MSSHRRVWLERQIRLVRGPRTPGSAWEAPRRTQDGLVERGPERTRGNMGRQGCALISAGTGAAASAVPVPGTALLRQGRA